jgi:CRP-like cAMP-binding protein
MLNERLEEFRQETYRVKENPEDEPLPVPRLCGHCDPLYATEIGRIFPEGNNMCLGCGRRTEWKSNISHIELPPAPERSKFGPRQHHQFKHLTCDAVTRVEARLLQNERNRLMEELAKNLGPKQMREQREEVEIAAIRAICRKDPKDRTLEDLDFLRSWLREKKFFKELGVPLQIESHVAKHLVVDRFEPQENMWNKGEWAPCAYLVLKGRVLLWDGDKEGEDNARMRAAGHILGRDDVLEKGALIQVKKHPKRLSSCRAERETETLALSLESFQVIQKHHEEVALREKVRFLIQNFKPVRGLTETDLRQPGSAFDKEREIQQLFTMEGAGKNDVLVKDGLRIPFEEARYMLIISGEVEIRTKKGNLIDTLTQGGYVHKEALYGVTSKFCAVVTSPKVVFISIRAKDYLMQFERRDHPLVPAKGQFDDDEAVKVKLDPTAMASNLKQPLQLQQDRNHLHAVLWKELQGAQIPPREAPAPLCGLFTEPSDTGVYSPTTLGYPTESDLFPQIRRKQLKQQQQQQQQQLTQSRAAADAGTNRDMPNFQPHRADTERSSVHQQQGKVSSVALMERKSRNDYVVRSFPVRPSIPQSARTSRQVGGSASARDGRLSLLATSGAIAIAVPHRQIGDTSVRNTI